MNDVAPARLDSRRDLDRVPGWFPATDQSLFRGLLEFQDRNGTRGGLVELGAYLGKSAILIGDYVRTGEDFTVIDLFGAEADDIANSSENASSYSTLTRSAFEANYLRFHPAVPAVHTALTSTVADVVSDRSVRFMHIDASHLYDHVSADTDSAQGLLSDDGIVAFDDFRAHHTPGVAAAVWEAVLNKGLRPICVSNQKFYGTWGDPAPARRAVETLYASKQSTTRLDLQRVAGHPLLRVEPLTAASLPRRVVNKAKLVARQRLLN